MSDNGAMTIVEFLEARISEDENLAQALLRDLEGQIREEYADARDEQGPMTPARLLSGQMWAHYDGQSKRRSFAKGQQIARLASPEKVLAECAAKRAIMAEHEPVQRRYSPDSCSACADWEDSEVGEGPPSIEWPCPTILAMASIYADHSDYRSEWAVK